MNKALLALTVVSSLLPLTGCQTASNDTRVASSSMVESKSEAAKLNELTQQYFDESLARNPLMATFVGVHRYDDKFNPPLSEQFLADTKAFEQSYLDRINQIDASKLEGQDWLSYEIFKYDRQHTLAGWDFENQYLPLSQMGGAHTYFAMLGSGQSAQPFKTSHDYREFMLRAEGFAEFMDSTIIYMKKGVKSGVVLPRPIAEKVLPQLSSHIVQDVTQSVFYAPVATLNTLTDISAEEKVALQDEYIDMIRNTIIPAYDRVYQYMKNEYLDSARDTVGLSALPDGQQWYEYQIQTHTTLPLTAEEIHAFGQNEVKRILGQMKNVKERVGFDGNLQDFFKHLRTSDEFYFESEEAVIEAYTNVKNKIDSRLPQLFSVFPKADYEVRAVEPYRAASAAAASYQPPAPDGSRPGIFYINTHNLKAQPKFVLETLSIHEAAPGHHFQIAIQQEVEGLPQFRKFNNYTVFAEGWALYAESLGKELGMFEDPYQWYGRLVDEQLRAMRLVVDTGLHAKGWTRQQAIDFMTANSSMPDSDVVAEVERYISMPGQALAYKVGERHIKQLRQQAEDELGDKFDIRAFHKQVLIDGGIPMPLLSEKIKRWVASQKLEG
ncbi:DUF885 domain-containing protein [Alteromonas sp. ASW11-130]|uniref:DUF885 domain-containing protein n=1 Tax=Alteromonas sp. ASW11-130 TaxID=3015775 RepID=UPI0022427628|nr:DUF885 domain-containing protein [Alteromonas sp. ASW11-130]MCW8092091.1 DUF885 domain-containing protein [Alteromonas sp. ASW11-130]